MPPQQPIHRHALLAHPVIAAERRHHYNMARTMAGLSLNFIIVVTPWTLKEVVVSCTGTKVIDIYNYMECLYLGQCMASILSREEARLL